MLAVASYRPFPFALNKQANETISQNIKLFAVTYMCQFMPRHFKKRFPGFTVNIYNIWSVYTVSLFCLFAFRASVTIFFWGGFCETHIQCSMIHIAFFFVSDCMFHWRPNADSFLQITSSSQIWIMSHIQICWFSVKFTVHTVTLNVFFELTLITCHCCQQCFARWFLAWLLCFVSLYTTL